MMCNSVLQIIFFMFHFNHSVAVHNRRVYVRVYVCVRVCVCVCVCCWGGVALYGILHKVYYGVTPSTVEYSGFVLV